MTETILISLLVTAVVAFIGFLMNLRLIGPMLRKRKDYKIIWKHSKLLKPGHVLGIRALKEQGFDPYYYERDHDRVIREKLARGENILVCGNPLAGKTRAVYEALKSTEKTHYVTVPDPEQIGTGEFTVPRFMSLLPGAKKRRVLILDEIDKFSDKERAKFIVGRFMGAGVILVATCRSGEEYDKFEENELQKRVFGNPVEIPPLSQKEADRVAKETGKTAPDAFDGNIGSIFVDLKGMRKRYKKLGEDEKRLILSIKYLYEMGVYRGKDLFPIQWIMAASEHKYSFKPTPFDRDEILNKLRENGFIVLEKDAVRVGDAYLDLVIDDIPISLDDFHTMTAALAADPEALHFLGNKAIGIGERVTDKAHLMKAAIGAFQSTLKIWTKKNSRYLFATVKNSLGIAYGILSEVEKPRENIEESIKNFKEALRVYTLKEFPMDYAMTQNNLGVSYRGLSQLDDPAGNLKLAVAAYREALRVYTLKEFPIQYAGTQNNLGVSYDELAKLDDPAGNLKLAVAAYREALRVQTPEDLPINHALTMENLGITYAGLAEHEESEKNFSLAVKALEAALVIFRQQKMTLNIEKAERNLTRIKAARGTVLAPKKQK